MMQEIVFRCLQCDFMIICMAEVSLDSSMSKMGIILLSALIHIYNITEQTLQTIFFRKISRINLQTINSFNNYLIFINLNFILIIEQVIRRIMRTHRKNVQIINKSSVLDGSLIRQQKINQQLQKMKDDLGPLNSAKDSTCSLDQTCKSMMRRQSKVQTNKFSTSFLNKNKLGLRKVLQEQKIKNIVRNFRTKLKRNLINSEPVEYEPYKKDQIQGFWVTKGLKYPLWLDLILSVISIALILIICFIYPLEIVFKDFMYDNQTLNLQVICVFFYFFEIVSNFVTIKNIEGRKVTLIKDIFQDYIHRKFPLDMLCFIILLTDAIFPTQPTRYLRLCVLLKAKQCFEKLQKIQNIFINNFYKEQYWALAKVFLVNFAFAHCLAILLIAMSNLSPENNWLMKIQAFNSPWYEQYTWAYYWGCTIMLTVGFGDITATNYKEAICITLIETFSCILLAYNINCVGNLINNIRQQDIEKNKNLKIMRRLAQENDITEQLETKVCNYIDQSDKMQKKFGFQAEKQFVSHLPLELKADFLKQSNIKIFEHLHFFTNFTEKTLLALSQFIEIKIAHPEEIILKLENKPQFIILKQGQVGYCTKRNGFEFSGTVVDLLKVNKKQSPLVLDLNFLRSQPFQTKFQIKSINYSMIYKITLEDLISTLKNSVLDFESFCESRDKSRHLVDQYEVIYCPYCPTKHSKMRCPKLHYIPLKQLVFYKYLEEVKGGVNNRQQMQRIESRSQQAKPLKLRKHFKRLEQQIYKGTNRKDMILRIRNGKQQQNCQGQNKNIQGIDNTFHLLDAGLSIQQNKGFAKLQRAIVEKLNALFDEKTTGIKKIFWDLETDDVENFKFYFTPFNASELSLDLRVSKNKQNEGKGSQKVLNMIKTMKSSVYSQNFMN